MKAKGKAKASADVPKGSRVAKADAAKAGKVAKADAAKGSKAALGSKAAFNTVKDTKALHARMKSTMASASDILSEIMTREEWKKL